jgi:hypothetical protein
MTLDTVERGTPIRTWHPLFSLGLDDETIISDEASGTLTARRAIGSWDTDSVVVPSSKPGIEEHWFVLPGIGYAAPTGAGERTIRVMVSHEPTRIRAVVGPHQPMTFERISQEIDLIKEGLGLFVSQVSQLVGIPRTSLYRKRGLAAKVDYRLFPIALKTEFLAGLMRESRTATESLVKSRFAEVRGRLDEGDFVRVRELFSDAKRQMAAARATPEERSSNSMSELTDQARSVLSQPGLEAAVELLIELNASKLDVDRGRAFVELDDAVRSAKRADDLQEPWRFLFTLRHADMDRVRERSLNFIRSDDFTMDRWRQSIDREASEAWDRYSIGLLPELEPESDEVLGADGHLATEEPDLSEFGLHEFFYDRRGR